MTAIGSRGQLRGMRVLKHANDRQSVIVLLTNITLTGLGGQCARKYHPANRSCKIAFTASVDA
jgi:hypothetical protein